MPPISTFTDFMRLTGPSYLTGPEKMVNDAVSQTYVLGRFLRGSDMAEVLQGGTDIRDTVMFDEQSTAQNYRPNVTLAPVNPQVAVNWKQFWRFTLDYMTWSKHELELQVPAGLTKSARHQIYKRLKRVKEMRMWTSMLNFMEASLWAVPRAVDQEVETGEQPQSIPNIVNEWSDALFWKRTGGTTTGETAFTVKQTIDPVVEPRWTPQGTDTLGVNGNTAPSATNLSYNSSSPTATGTNRNIVQTFDMAWMFTDFQTPPTKEEYFENPTLYKQFICCSFRGQAIYMDILRQSQDLFVTKSRQDPSFVNPNYAGIDVLRIKALNSAALYPNDTATSAPVGELAGVNTVEDVGPRYYWLNGNYITPIFHSTNFFNKEEPLRARDQPFTWVQYVDTWWQLVARSLQRHALVRPSGDIYTV